MSEFRDRPAGTIRLTTIDYVVDTILWPKLSGFLRQYPDIKIEIVVDYGLTDIVAERFDAGVRGGEQVAKDMIAVRIGPDLRMAVVGAPAYFKKRSQPRMPQELVEQTASMASNQGLYNLFLVVALVLGLGLSDPSLSNAFAAYGLGCVGVAGIWGAVTVSPRIALVQTVPALLALIAFYIGI